MVDRSNYFFNFGVSFKLLAIGGSIIENFEWSRVSLNSKLCLTCCLISKKVCLPGFVRVLALCFPLCRQQMEERRLVKPSCRLDLHF